MSRIKVLYLAPKADERDFHHFDVEFLHFEGTVKIDGSLLCFRDEKKKKTKRIPYHRIRQVEIYPTAVERDQLITKHKTQKESEVYYWKVFLENDWIERISNIGEKPHGMTCILEEITPFFVTVIVPSFKARIILPINAIAGLDTIG